MKKRINLVAFMCSSMVIFSNPNADELLEAYQRAESFLPWHAQKWGFDLEVIPHWHDDGTFWYLNKSPQSKRFIVVDTRTLSSRPAFDHNRLAASLSKALKKKVFAEQQPFEEFTWVANKNAIRVVLGGSSWRCNLKNYRCSSTNRQIAQAHEKISPDGRWIVYLQDHNLWLRSTSNGRAIQLSFDGRPGYDYGRDDHSPDFKLGANDPPPPHYLSALWSPDSKSIFVFRTDKRKVATTPLIQHVPPGNDQRPIAYEYSYELPGDTHLTLAEPVIFHIETGKQVNIRWSPLLMPLLSWHILRRGTWSDDASRFFLIDVERGSKKAWLIEADAATGRARCVFQEQAETLVDHNVQLLAVINQSKEIVWSSERDGYNHLYLIDAATGRLKYRLTRGPWVVRSIEHIDEKNRWIYFSAGGKEPDRNPYLRHLYKVAMDGTELTLLTPEPADHRIDFSPDGHSFVDNYSTIDTVPTSVLRRSHDGHILYKFPQASLEHLKAKNFRLPTPFSAKARDGVTPIYGVMFLPSNFNQNKKYPVIENIYSGPHSFNTPVRFPTHRRELTNVLLSQSIAELGFVVIIIDGQGQNHRGRRFRDRQYRNLADCGFPDRISAMKELAKRNPFMDLTRVGIFGFSAGGYASARALLDHPEFYKVAVSSAGNHDHRMDKLSWNERWMGYPVAEHYEKQSNIFNADKIKGKLLLTVGDLDTNVPPASTFHMVHALIKANKDFDFMVYPNRGHYLDDDPYFIRQRWDYFTRHLLKIEPPQEYKIEKSVNGE